MANFPDNRSNKNENSIVSNTHSGLRRCSDDKFSSQEQPFNKNDYSGGAEAVVMPTFQPSFRFQ